MNSLAKLLLLSVICIAVVIFTVELAKAADPGPDSANCAISVTVDSIIEWEDTDFPAIDLNTQAASISAQADTPEGSSSYTLWLNCNVALSANNTASGPAELTNGTDILVTKYKISTDGDGSAATGADGVAVSNSDSDIWTEYDSFLLTPLQITHVNTDGSVEILLEVQASNDPEGHKEVADSGNYAATQTITATWMSDN